MGFGRVGASDRKIHQCRKGAEIGLLLEHHDMRAGDDHPLALVGVDLPGEQLEQSRLARAVAADQRQPVARPDIDVDILEQPAAALHKAERSEERRVGKEGVSTIRTRGSTKVSEKKRRTKKTIQ